MAPMAASDHALAERQVALVDLLDRLLAGGVVLAGDLTLRIADVDLVRIDLNALVSSVSAEVPSPFESAYEESAYEEADGSAYASDGPGLPTGSYDRFGEGS
ncbi:gas vesicle protein GvpA/GvpJ/GvpM family [Streptomyces sp. TLI_146]|nr:gas vesicle protein GvpA/GvpJ/GvpM family [Streptomyces sp. TLI_146]